MRSNRNAQDGLTLLELLVTISIVGILAAMLLSAISSAKLRAQRAVCTSNLRQLSAACRLYTDDHSGTLPSSWPKGWGDAPVNPYSWCPGWASTKPEDPGYGPLPQFSCTNTYAIKQGVIWPYVNAVGLYRCPADGRTLGGLPVVRSYSMNAWMAGRSWGDPTGLTTFLSPEEDSSLTYTFYRNEGQITQPSQTLYLIDEDGDTINDSMFCVDMAGQNQVPDRPARRHGPAYVLTFADGHAETIPLLQPDAAWTNAEPDADWINLKKWTTTEQSGGPVAE